LKNIQHIPGFIILAIISLMLAACASQPEVAKSDSLDQMIDDVFKSEQVNSSSKQNTTDDDIALALLPDINLSAPGMGSIDVEPRFDLKVNRAKARQFFMGLVDGSAYNMVLHPKVSGRITLDLKNITVQEVMEVVRDIYGYDFEQSETAYSVFPNEIRTQIFNINYINVSRTGSSQMSVKSNTVTGEKAGSSGSDIETTSTSAFWEKLDANIKALIGTKEGRSVLVSPQSGIVVVRALPQELRLVKKFIKETQEFVQRQVIIKAKILEVELNERFQTGINWASLQESGSDSALIGQTGGGTLFGGSNLSGIAGNSGDLNPAALDPVTGTAVSAFGGMFSLALNLGSGFGAFIEVLKSQGDVHVLSSPQVSSINNQKAVIKVGTDEFFITNVTSTISAGAVTGTSTNQSNATFTPFFSGVALDITPQISENDEVILHVHPTVSSVTEKTKTVNAAATTALSVPLAVTSVRESDSIIRAKSGQVVIIGGLMQNSVEQRTSKVPLLGDIPLVGGLFRHSQDIDKKSELVILLKPIVTTSDEEMAEQVKKAKANFKQLRTRQ